MAFFRKQPPETNDEEQASVPQRPIPPPVGSAASPTQVAVAPAAPAAAPALFNGPTVDIDAIYKHAKLSAEELDRVARAEQLLKFLPTTASHTREVVDATFRAFGVDRAKILEASAKQLRALEEFLRFSQEQTQLALDANSKRIAELEGAIAGCRQVSANAASEGEERARSVNELLLKAERVLDFLGNEVRVPPDSDLEVTVVKKPDPTSKLDTANKPDRAKATEPPPLGSRRPGTP